MTETANPVLDQTSSLARPGSTLACALVGLVILVAASSCGGTRHERWVTCLRPPEGADVRQLRVKGGETCGHARRVLDYAAFGHGRPSPRMHEAEPSRGLYLPAVTVKPASRTDV
jgi:hypothetical protein